MIYLLFYVFLYCNADNILHKLYLSKYATVTNNDLIQYNDNFYYSITTQFFFALSVYVFYIIKHTIYYNPINNTSIALSFVYTKYILTFLLSTNMTITQYESNRNTMWLFSTPLMMKIYCDVNNLKLYQVNLPFHIIPVIINIFIHPYKDTIIYYYFTGVSWILILFFIRELYKKSSLTFTNIYLFIWGIFMCLNAVEICKIIDRYDINIYYLYADTISKIITNIIVNDYNEKKLTQINNMDLQSVQFVSYMIKNINKYKCDNSIITPRCNNFISLTSQYFSVKIPDNIAVLEQELLKKILPLNLGKEYITNYNSTTTTHDKNGNKSLSNPKQFHMICILFTDIVNYTELAKKYNDKLIFQLLYSIYTTFDTTIKMYPHLQKIETIGDAYMVAGDIFRITKNHKDVVKEIILFALDIIKDIKTIQTPDNVPLSIRIGINIGDVSVGILGNEIPRLCVVGNTVNMASRLQSTADVDTIQLSNHIYEHIKDIDFGVDFEIAMKENVFLKNMGSVTTYNITPYLHYDNT